MSRIAFFVVFLLGTASRPSPAAACTFGKMDCPSSSQTVCLNPFEFVECAVKTFFNIDEIIKDFTEIFKEVMEDAANKLINAALAEVTDAFDQAVSCFEFLTGKTPDCALMKNIEDCIATAANAATAGKGTKAYKALKTVNKKKYDAGTKALTKTKNAVDKMCGEACDGSLCSGGEKLNPPDGCVCREYIATKDGAKETTPTYCAENLAFFDDDGKFTGRRVLFSYYGCYVGISTDPSSYANCTQAYESSVFNNGVFVRCLDSEGNEVPTGSVRSAVPSALIFLTTILTFACQIGRAHV